MRKLGLILLLLFLGFQNFAITVTLCVTNEGKNLDQTIPGITESNMSFRVWLDGREDEAVGDGAIGLGDSWYLWNDEMYLEFDTDILTMSTSGKKMWIEITESSTNLVRREFFILTNTSSDFVVDLSGVYESKPILKINAPLAVCQPEVVDLANPSVTAGSDVGLELHYCSDRQGLNSIASIVNTSGEYYIYGIKDGVSSDTLSVNVTINPKPTVTLAANVSNNSTICSGDALNLTAGGISVGKYAWYISGSDEVFKTGEVDCSKNTQSNLKPISSNVKYKVVGTNAEGCSAADSVSLTVYRAPTSALQVDDNPVCAGVPTLLTANAKPSVSGAKLTYTWTEATKIGTGETATFKSSTPGTTKCLVLIQEDGNTCWKKDSVEITVNPRPTDLKIDVPTIRCSNAGTIQFTASAKGTGVTYNWTSPNSVSGSVYNYATTGSSETINLQVIASLPNGCKDTLKVSPVINLAPTIDKPTASLADLCAGAEVTLKVTPRIPATGLSYSWSTGGTTAEIKTSALADANWYKVTAKDANNCTVSDSVKVTGHKVSVEKITKTPGSDIVYGGTATLTATNVKWLPAADGEPSYEWKPAEMINGATNTGSVTTKQLSAEKIFTVIVTNNTYNCKDSASLTISPVVTSPLKISKFEVQAAYCKGDEIKLSVTATGGNTSKLYTWSSLTINGIPPTPGATNKYTIKTAGLVAGQTYDIKVKVDDGISSVDSIAHFVLNDVPSFDKFTPQVVCAGTSLTLEAKNPSAGITTYKWTNLSAIPGSSLGDGSAAVNAIAGAGINRFVLTATNSNSCSKTDTAVITGNKIMVDLGADQTFYYGATVKLKPQSISYIPANAYVESDLTYAWTPVDSINGSAVGKEITTKSLFGTTEFYLTVTGSKNSVTCEVKDTVKVIIQGDPLKIAPATVVASAEYCEGDTVKLLPNVTGGSGKYKFDWTTASSAWTSADSLPKITDWSAGAYTVTLIVTDTVTKYSVNADVAFTVNPAVTIGTDASVALSRPDTCAGALAQFNVVAQNGTGALTYTWSGGATGSGQNPFLTVASGKKDYIVTITDTKGCMVKDTVTVTGHSVVTNIAANPSSDIAYKATTVLTPTVTFTPDGEQGTPVYTWSPAGLVGVQDADGKVTSLALTADTTFTLVVADKFGCADTSSTRVTLKSFTPLQIDVISSDSAYCFGDDVKLNVKLKGGDVDNYTFAWSNDDVAITNAETSSATVDAKLLTAGAVYKFNLKVTDGKDGKACAVIDTFVNITINALPVVNITDKSREACKWSEETFVATANGVTYEWSAVRGSIMSGKTTASAKVKTSDQAGEDLFIVAVKDNTTGCINRDTAKVKIHAITLPTVNEPTVACGTAATLTLTAGSCSTGGTLSYTWGPAELFETTSSSGATTVGLDNGRTELYVAVKDDAKGCEDTLRFGVTSVGCDFMITVPDTVVVCEGGKVQIPVTSTKTGVTYQWTALGGGSVTNAGLVDVAGLAAKATYPFAVASTYTTNGFNVVRKDTVNVYVRKNPVVDLQGMGGCTNTLVTLTADVTDGEGSSYKYAWVGAQKIAAEPNKATLTLAGGAQTVAVTVKDEKGCEFTATKSLVGEELQATLAVVPETQVQPATEVTLKGGLAKGDPLRTTFIYSCVDPVYKALGNGQNLLSVKDSPNEVSTYRLVVRSNTGCKDSIDYLVNVKDDNRLFIKGNDLAVCAGTADLSAYKFSVRTYGGQIPYTYKWEVVDNAFTLGTPVSTVHNEGSQVTLTSVPSEAGVYRVIVTVTDAGGKSTTKGLILTVNKQPEIKINGETQGEMAACAGTGDYTVLATGPDGTTFKWDAPGTLLDRTDAEQNISVATANAGIPVTVIGEWKGCTTTVTRTLVVHAAPQLALAADKEEGCAGTEITLSAKATGARPFTYTWNGAARKVGADSAAVLTLAAGQNPVSVSVKDNNECEVTTDQIFTGHTIDVNLTGIPSAQIAQGETVKLKATATGGKANQYAFVKVETSSTTPVIAGIKDTVSVKPAASSVYRVVVTSDKGCKDSADYRVNVGSEIPSITVSDITICQGTPEVQAVAEALGGEANYDYTWSTTQAGITIDPVQQNGMTGASTVKLKGLAALAAGDYTIKVDVTDNNSKTASATFKLKVNARPVIKINNRLTDSDTTFCLNMANAKLTATGATAYQWLTPAGVAGNRDASLTLNTAVASSATEYKVVGTNTAGCSDTATINVTVQALPTVVINGADLACVGSTNTELQAQANGGAGTYTYVWMGATPVVGQSDKAIANAVNEDNTYTVTVTDKNKCQATATHQITGHKLTVFLDYSPKPADLNEKTELQASVTGGKAVNYEFVDVTNGRTIKKSASDTAWVYPSKITKYQVYVTSETLGCIDSMTTPVTVNVKNQPLKIEGTDKAICQATPDGSVNVTFTATASGGTGQYKYTWSVVDSPDQIQLTNTVDTPAEFGASSNKLKSIGNVVAGVYKIKVKVEDVDVDNNPLKDSTTMDLTVKALPQITISDKPDGSDTIVCQITDENIQLVAADMAIGTEWRWTAAGSFGTNPNKSVSVATADVTGTRYTVYGKNTLGCIDSASITVKINPMPSVSISGIEKGCKEQSVQLAAIPSGGTAPYKKKGYRWVNVNSSGDAVTLPDLLDSVITVKLLADLNLYQVMVTDTNGCTSTWSAEHRVTAVEGAAIKKLFVQDSCSEGKIVVRAVNADKGYTWKQLVGTGGEIMAGSADTIYTVKNAGKYEVRVIAKSSVAECSDSATISGHVWDVKLLAGLVSEKDTCGAEKLALNITKQGASAITGVKLTYTVNNTSVDTIFDATKLADASIKVTKPGIYKLVSIADTTSRCPGTIDVKDSVRVGFRPEVDILPHTAHDTLNVEVGTQFVLKTAKKCDIASADYTWTPAGKFTAYATPDSISHTFAEGDRDVKYILTAKGRDEVGCTVKDSIVVRIGEVSVDLEAPVVKIDTNTNRLDIKISWDPVVGATGYKVYKRKWDPYSLVTTNADAGAYVPASVNITEYIRSEVEVTQDSLAFFYVTAIAGDVESPASDTIGYVAHNIDASDSESAVNYVFPYIFDMKKYLEGDKIQHLLYYCFNGEVIARGIWTNPDQFFDMKNYNAKLGKWAPFEPTEDHELNRHDVYLITVKAGEKAKFVLLGYLKETRISFTIPEDINLPVWVPLEIADRNDYNTMTKDNWFFTVDEGGAMTDSNIDIKSLGVWDIENSDWKMSNPLRSTLWPQNGAPFSKSNIPLIRAGYDGVVFNTKKLISWP